MRIKNLRWFGAALVVAAALTVVLVAAAGSWSASPAGTGTVDASTSTVEGTPGYAWVNRVYQQVFKVSLEHPGIPDNHVAVQIVKIPDGVIVVPLHTHYDGENFIPRAWGWWNAAAAAQSVIPTATPAADATVAPTATSTPGPTATPTPAPTATPSGPTLESQIGDLWVQVVALQQQRDAQAATITGLLQELAAVQVRLSAAEAEIATLKGP